ncbi:SpoIIE family protein phosphatase [Kitasatospora sp. NPDC052896]|uniref:SpoIIE family protein phosphatase n=1 Tax=Kitasatospora sp. NPDC052896 TaxID=3364061 RepID=UPI0037C73C52
MFTGVALAALYVLDEDAGELRLAETAGDGAGAVDSLAPSYPLAGRSPVAAAFRSGRPLWLTPAEAAAGDGIDAALGAVPINTGRPGCLVIVERAGEQFTPDRRALLELYAGQVAARLGAAEPGAALDSTTVGSFTLLLDTGRIDADGPALDLLGIARDGFDGRVEALLTVTVPEDLPALMAVLAPDRVPREDRDLELRIRRPTGEVRWLRLRHRVVSGDGGRRPERVLAVLAEAGPLRPLRDEVSCVQRLTAALASARTVRDVGREVATALREPLGADRVAVFEYHAERPEAWRFGWGADWPGAPEPPVLEAALRQGGLSLWTADGERDPGLTGVGPGGLAVLPLPADGQLVGGCLLGWYEPREFGPGQRSLLAAAAGLAGQALARVRSLEAERELADTLQRGMLPRKLPTVPGCAAVARYLPATTGLDVGGDWYDLIPLSDRYVALVVGDVQGHSAEAATIMGQIRTAIRAYAVEGHPPDVVVSHANRLLVGMATDTFATCCYVTLDLEEGDAWFVRAGHLPPLLRAPDGGATEVAVEGGPPLGVFADTDFPMTMVGLAPGTVLVLLTDGLVESSSLRLEDGLRRVGELLAAADPSDAERMADELVGAAEQREDDVALLLLRFDGTTARPLRAGWAAWRLPDAVMHARRFTARTMRSWGVTAETDTILLVVSELVTNAMGHTQGEVRLDLTLAGERLRIAVSDSEPRAPVKPASVDWEATGGRGLLLVEAMSAAWGSVPLSGGKQVWSEIVLPAREPVVHSGRLPSAG